MLTSAWSLLALPIFQLPFASFPDTDTGPTWGARKASFARLCRMREPWAICHSWGIYATSEVTG